MEDEQDRGGLVSHSNDAKELCKEPLERFWQRIDHGRTRDSRPGGPVVVVQTESYTWTRMTALEMEINGKTWDVCGG